MEEKTHALNLQKDEVPILCIASDVLIPKQQIEKTDGLMKCDLVLCPSITTSNLTTQHLIPFHLECTILSTEIAEITKAKCCQATSPHCRYDEEDTIIL